MVSPCPSRCPPRIKAEGIESQTEALGYSLHQRAKFNEDWYNINILQYQYIVWRSQKSAWSLPPPRWRMRRRTAVPPRALEQRIITAVLTDGLPAVDTRREGPPQRFVL
jgi:hypothetical protein